MFPGHNGLMTKTLARWAPWRVLVSVSVAVLAISATRRIERREVTGTSMTPTLSPGDRVLFRRIGRRPIRVGSIVLLVDPRDGVTEVIKRVTTVDGQVAWVVGDNPGASTDSRTFGWVPRACLRAVMVRRYARAPLS